MRLPIGSVGNAPVEVSNARVAPELFVIVKATMKTITLCIIPELSNVPPAPLVKRLNDEHPVYVMLGIVVTAGDPTYVHVPNKVTFASPAGNCRLCEVAVTPILSNTRVLNLPIGCEVSASVISMLSA